MKQKAFYLSVLSLLILSACATQIPANGTPESNPPAATSKVDVTVVRGEIPGQDNVIVPPTEEAAQSEEASAEANTGKPTVTVTNLYSMDQIALHDKAGNCWLLINGKVYDVSNFETHPGGEAILLGCGKDATSLFNAKPTNGKPHSDKAQAGMEKFLIGELTE